MKKGGHNWPRGEGYIGYCVKTFSHQIDCHWAVFVSVYKQEKERRRFSQWHLLWMHSCFPYFCTSVPLAEGPIYFQCSKELQCCALTPSIYSHHIEGHCGRSPSHSNSSGAFWTQPVFLLLPHTVVQKEAGLDYLKTLRACNQKLRSRLLSTFWPWTGLF